jgi:hypothetical protein
MATVKSLIPYKKKLQEIVNYKETLLQKMKDLKYVQDKCINEAKEALKGVYVTEPYMFFFKTRYPIELEVRTYTLSVKDHTPKSNYILKAFRIKVEEEYLADLKPKYENVCETLQDYQQLLITVRKVEDLLALTNCKLSHDLEVTDSLIRSICTFKPL